MSYYKRLLSLGRSGAPMHREANQDLARMWDVRYTLYRPLSDHQTRYHR